MVAAGASVESALIRHGLRTAEAARATALELVSEHSPEAIFTSQNLVTIGVIGALHAAARQHEIALVGFDDVPLADALQPGVTVMAQDPAAIGRLAADLLVRRMAGDVSPPAVHVVKTRLIARGSGELPLPSRR
jgi:LacI family transcriptional regulator